MLYLFGDESRNPGTDNTFCIGFLITKDSKPHIQKIRELREKYNYYNEIKYSNGNYSQLLIAIDLIDYFFNSSGLNFKIIVKDKKYFDVSFYNNNRYGAKPEDLAYVCSYKELTKSISPQKFGEEEKFCLIDQKPQTASGILTDFVIKNDSSVVVFEQKGSSDIANSGNFEGYSEMIQFTDLITGIIGGLCSEKSGKCQNVYKKRFLINLGVKEKELASIYTAKKNFYYPSFADAKVNVWYWKPQ